MREACSALPGSTLSLKDDTESKATALVPAQLAPALPVAVWQIVCSVVDSVAPARALPADGKMDTSDDASSVAGNHAGHAGDWRLCESMLLLCPQLLNAVFDKLTSRLREGRSEFVAHALLKLLRFVLSSVLVVIVFLLQLACGSWPG